MRKFLILFRKYFFVLLAFFSYIFFSYNFYVNKYWLMASVFLILFYIFVHFFFIELKNHGLKYFVSIILLSAVMQMLFIGFENIFLILSIWIINIGIISLLNSIDGEVNNRKKISSYSIFNMGVSGFSIFSALSFALMFLGTYDNFTLTCDTLNTNTSKFIDFVSRPLKFSVGEVSDLKNKITGFYNQKFVDVIGFDTGQSLVCSGNSNSSGTVYEMVDMDYFSKFLKNQKVLSGNNLAFTGKNLTGKNLIGKNLSINSSIGENTDLTGQICQFLSGKSSQDLTSLVNKNSDEKTGIIGFFAKTQSEVLQTMSDKKQLDKGFCDVMITSIQEKYKNPGFRVSVVLLLFFVLWPFLRIIFAIVGFLGYFVFMLLRLLKIYQINLITQEVEEVE